MSLISNLLEDLGLRKPKKSHAGLHISDDKIRYIELVNGFDGMNKTSIAKMYSIKISDDKTMKKNSMIDIGGIQKHLESMISTYGTFRSPVNIGIPSRDCMIRLIEMPQMTKEEAIQSLRWDFDKHFPYSYDEAAVDISLIDVPPGHCAPNNMLALVSACKTKFIDSLVRVCSSAGIVLDGMEPDNIAMFRGIVGPIASFNSGYMLASMHKEYIQMVFGCNDNGIMYRTSPMDSHDITAIAKEINNTLVFTKNQYRNINLDQIFLSGDMSERKDLTEAVTEIVGINVSVVNPWEVWGMSVPENDCYGWDSAIGLAVKEI